MIVLVLVLVGVFLVSLPFVGWLACAADDASARRDSMTRHPAGTHWLDPEPDPIDVAIDVTDIDPGLGLFAWLTASMPDPAFERFARDTAGAPLPNR